MDSDCMGRQLLSTQPPETDICSSLSSVPLCLCEQCDFKAKAYVISGETLYSSPFMLFIQLPDVFLCCLFVLFFCLLCVKLVSLQALTESTRHQAIKDANLSGRKLTAIRDLLMRQYQQVWSHFWHIRIIFIFKWGLFVLKYRESLIINS